MVLVMKKDVDGEIVGKTFIFHILFCCDGFLSIFSTKQSAIVSESDQSNLNAYHAITAALGQLKYIRHLIVDRPFMSALNISTDTQCPQNNQLIT